MEVEASIFKQKHQVSMNFMSFQNHEFFKVTFAFQQHVARIGAPDFYFVNINSFGKWIPVVVPAIPLDAIAAA